MASSSSNWMPVQGQHPVTIGSSLRRALKARRLHGNPPPNTKRSIPDRDFYSFRYNFKPGTIDANKPGSIHVRAEGAKTAVTVEHPITKAGEAALFTGNEQPAKEVDCVLIYDEETNTFTLEKLDSYISLKHERKTFRRQLSQHLLQPPHRHRQ
ncbi:RNA polymerase II transcription elongation factor-domain-containing protein [Cyathus striatus]|nr:RNA polymerase II transcription elongation factor-domain-containing protein [Cyathus striatus]